MRHIYPAYRDLWGNAPILVTQDTPFYIFWTSLTLAILNLICSPPIVTLSTTLAFLATCLVLTGCVYTVIGINYGYIFVDLTSVQRRHFRLAFGFLGCGAFFLSCGIWARCTWEGVTSNSTFSIPILIFLFSQFLPPLCLLVATHHDYSQYYTIISPITKTPLIYSQTFPEYAAAHSPQPPSHKHTNPQD